MIDYEIYDSKPFEYIIKADYHKDDGNTFVFKGITDKGRELYIQVHIAANSIVRVVGGVDDKTPQYDNDLIVDKYFKTQNAEYDVKKSSDKAIISTEKICIEISLDPWNITFKDLFGRTILAESSNDVNPVDKLRAKPIGTTYNEQDGEILEYNECFNIKPDEHFYGLGEKFTEFDKRQQKIISWNRDALGVRNELAYKNIPFFMSTSGYGLFVNSTEAVKFDIGSFSSSSLMIGVPGGVLDYYFIYGPAFKDILYMYTQMTGKAPIPPLWSFGLWMSTGFFGANRTSVEQCANKVRNRAIPCDVMHFDCFWLKDNMWCDFEWDENNYPNTEEMIANLKEQGYKICLWINPYVSVRSRMFEEGEANEYFLKKSNGKVYVRDMWHGLYPECGIIDVTNGEAVEWFKGKLRNLFTMGVDILKTDFGEDIPVDAVYSNGKPGSQMHNLYSLLYNKIVFEVTSEFKDQPIVWGRSGYAGSQRYPVCWSGDPACTYEAMASVLRGGLSYGMSGVPFWSHDIGGFYGKPSKELYVRWAQFGLFSSHSRCHGTTTRDPWEFGEEAEELFSKYVNLRYRLLPYIYSTAIESSKTAMPFIRPLVLMHQDDPATYQVDDEYYFGNSMLIAPIFSDDNKRKIYLPEGEWIDYWTNKVYKGKQWISYNAPLDILPIFIRKGAVIPILNKDIQCIDENTLKSGMELEVYDNSDTTCKIYTDEGEFGIKVNISDEFVNMRYAGKDQKIKVHIKL